MNEKPDEEIAEWAYLEESSTAPNMESYLITQEKKRKKLLLKARNERYRANHPTKKSALMQKQEQGMREIEGKGS